jgi:hypothetical protein
MTTQDGGAFDGRAPGRTPALSPATLKELDAQHRALEAAPGSAAGPLWGAMHKLLLKAKVPPADIMPLVAGRDLDGLRRLLARLRGDPVEAPAAPAAATPREAVDDDTMRLALKAFRHRLKVMRLDAESKLGVGPMSGGKKHGIDAISAPREHPLAVWEALADAGKLRRAGPGFYGLAEEGE